MGEGALTVRLVPGSFITRLVGYHGEPKVSPFHNIRIISGLYYPKRLKVTYSTTRILFVRLYILVFSAEAPISGCPNCLDTSEKIAPKGLPPKLTP